ncbi:hypothetical protein TDB9533_03757 [Thalassocella blandensis]|nr:hypothetical protein TDB9533_03757 [Thalassocella blandensis]
MTKENLILASLLVAMLSFWGYRYYTNTPEYIAQQHYESGMAALEQQQYKQGIADLGEALNSQTQVSDQAKAALNTLLDKSFLNTLPLEQKHQIFTSIHPYHHINPAYPQILEEQFSASENENPYIAGQLAMLLAQVVEDEETAYRFNQQAHALLFAELATLKQDKDLAMDLALLDEALYGCDNCESILSNFRDELGDHEAARALGQYYAATGNVDAAFTLLKPYTDKHIAEYHEAEKHYNATLDKIWDETIDFLDKGNGPESFYNAYDQADDEGKNRILNEYYSDRLAASQEADQALVRYQNAASVVPVALDMGIVRLGRAMTITDTEQRTAELNEAETIFLAVKAFASDSDDYQLYLGQVYYWLGKADQGDELFTALINKYERSDTILSSIASVMRNLGAKAKATEYIEEAYTKASDPESKQSYAYQRYMLSTDLDDRISWIEKSDMTSGYVKADMHSAKAEKAERENNKKLALEHYQSAIDVYSDLPETLSLYNNIALIYMSKYDLGRNITDYDLALSNMDKAVQIGSDDSIVLSNAADYYAMRVYKDVLGEKLDLSVLQYRPSLDLFSYLYTNNEQKMEIIEEIKQHPHFNKMMEYTKKASILSPKSSDSFYMAYEIMDFLRLNNEIQNILPRLDAITLEQKQDEDAQRKFRSGESHEKSISSIKESIALYQKRYSALNGKEHPLERAIIDSTLMKLQLSLITFGEKIDINQLLQQAESHYNNVPSSATRALYTDILEQKLIEESRSISPEFSTLHDNYKYIFDRDSLIYLGLSGLTEYRMAIQKHTLFKRYVDVRIKANALFPDRPSANDWFLFHLIDHELSATLKTKYSDFELAQYRSKIYQKTGVNKEEMALHKYIELLLKSDTDKAQKVLKESKAAGVSIPDILII